MGILNNIFKKINSGFFYVVDKEKLKEFLNHEMHFGLENNLEDCTDLNVYING